MTSGSGALSQRRGALRGSGKRFQQLPIERGQVFDLPLGAGGGNSQFPDPLVQGFGGGMDALHALQPSLELHMMFAHLGFHRRHQGL